MISRLTTGTAYHAGVSAGMAALLFLRMPVHAQQIMSFEEYQSVDHAEPYVYRLRTDSGALLYFGSRHSFDPTDSQMDQLEELWNAFEPDVMYTEGTRVLEIDSLSRREIIRRYGEVGLTWLLAHRDGVPIRTLDPSRSVEVARMRDRGWTDEQLMLFYTLRQVAQSRDQQSAVDLAEVVPQYLNSLVERFDLQGPTMLSQFEDAVRRLLPHVQSWETISNSYFYPGPQSPSYFTNRLSTDANQFRDQFHVDQLVEAVRANKCVFVVAGSAHAVMQEPALKAVLQSR